MNRYGCGRVLIIAVAIGLVLTTSLSVFAEDLFVNIDVAGNVDAQFHGLAIFAAISGEVGLVGEFSLGESSSWFSASGNVDGVGHRNILSLITKGWILIRATGVTADTESITIRSLLYASRESLIPLQAGELFEGVHHTVVQIGEAITVYWGEFAGTLAGGLVPAETEGTIRLSGSGGFSLSGERIPDVSSDGFPAAISLDDPDLPDSFFQAIAEFFDLRSVGE